MSLLTEPVPHEEAADLIRGKTSVTRAIFDRLLPEIQQRAFVVTGVECVKTLDRVKEITAGLPRGEDWQESKKAILNEISPWLITATDAEEREKQFAAAGRRAELILRNQGWSSYAVTQHEQIMAHKDVFPFCEYLTSEDARVRPSHAALDHLILPTESPFWATHTPPWEFGCRCDKVPRLAEDVHEIAHEEAHKAPEDRQVVSGSHLDMMEQGRLVRPNGAGVMDIRTPKEKTGTGFEFRPDTLKLTYTQILEGYSHEAASAFKTWAERLEITPGCTLAQSLSESRASHSPAEPDPKLHVAMSDSANPPVRISPVSDAITLRIKDGKSVREALSAIDRVHDDGLLPHIPLYGNPSGTKTGEYTYYKSGRPDRIDILASGPHPDITTAHEIGHVLDHLALGKPGSFASLDPAREVGRIVSLLRATPTFGRMLAESVNPGYHGDPRELWARAYAQYITRMSNHPEMTRQLESILAGPDSPWRQWPDHEFDPILREITVMLEHKKWNPISWTAKKDV